MRERDKDAIRRLLGDERALSAKKVRFAVGVDGATQKGRLVQSKSLILLYAPTPMGMQATMVWYRDLEHVTVGKKKGRYYVQLLGHDSRILVLFKAEETRDKFKETCEAWVHNNNT